MGGQILGYNNKNYPIQKLGKTKEWKSENWKLHSSTIQSKIPIAIACQGFTEPNCILFQSSRTKNWYLELKVSHTLCIFVFQFLSILIAFSLLIYTNWTILNLTMLFNWVFVHCMRNHHWSFLGFQRSWIGASLFWKNWDMRLVPSEPEASHESSHPIAPNLWTTRAYSLFFTFAT